MLYSQLSDPIKHQDVLEEAPRSYEVNTLKEQSSKLSRAAKLNYWLPEEQAVYLQYLKEHMPMIHSPQYRKQHRIFKEISKRLGTRTPIQVKSHHQKLEQKYENIQRIIIHLQKTLKINTNCSEETLNNTFSLPPVSIQCMEEYQSMAIELKNFYVKAEDCEEQPIIHLKFK